MKNRSCGQRNCYVFSYRELVHLRQLYFGNFLHVLTVVDLRKMTVISARLHEVNGDAQQEVARTPT